MMPEIVSLTSQWLLILAPIGALLYWNSLHVRRSSAPRLTLAEVGVFVGAMVLLLIAVLIAEPFIETLDISEANWRIAAGVLLILNAARLVLLRDPFSAEPLHGDGDPPYLRITRAVIWLANPASLAAAMSYALHRGTGTTLTASGVALVATMMMLGGSVAIERRAGRPVLRETARALLLGTVLVGLRLIIDGVDGI
jgi:small neutral amino acid transporter SnatA (MarC family)